MHRLDALYPAYGFASHVGYITPGHSAVVRERGPCEIHRLSFEARCYAEQTVGAALGPRAERRVRLYYRLRGYRVLAANARAGRNEPDIVSAARAEARLLRGQGPEAVTATATRERRSAPRRSGASAAAAEIWLARNPDCHELEIAFEVVGVRGRLIERVPLRARDAGRGCGRCRRGLAAEIAVVEDVDAPVVVLPCRRSRSRVRSGRDPRRSCRRRDRLRRNSARPSRRRRISARFAPRRRSRSR